MSQDWTLPAWAALSVAVLVLLALAGAVWGLRRASVTERGLARLEVAASAESAALRERLDAMQRALARPSPTSHSAPRQQADYLITHLGEPTSAPTGLDRAPDGAQRLGPSAPLFADLVAREGVVQAAALACGVRRALAPQTRARIRVGMRQELKRARRARRAELRAARRDLRERERATVDGRAA